MAYTIKAKHGDDLRRLTLSSPHISQLTSTVTSLFNLPSPPSSSSLKIRYMDDDGDWITISSDQELQEAFLTVKGLPLRVDVISTATPTFPVAIAVGEPVPAPVSPSSSTSSFAVVEGNAQVLSDEEQEQQDDDAEESEEEEEQESSESEEEEEEEEEEEDDDESDEESEDESEEESEEEEEEEEEQECVTGSSSSVTLAEEKQPQEDDTSSSTTTPPTTTPIVVNVDDEMEGKAAAAAADDDFIPPPPPVEDADQKLQLQTEAEEKKGEEPPRAELFDYVANEFHYHRIIIQTAVEAAFDSIRGQYTATYKPKATEYLNKADTQRVLIIEAIERTLEEWKRDINTYPPAQEISQRVSDSLLEIGTFAAPVLDNIRASLTAALESLFKKKNPHAITSSDVLRELDTFTPRPEDLPEQPEPAQETGKFAEEMESVLSQVSVVEQPQATSDIHIGSNLAGDFVYVQEHDDFAYKQQLDEMLLMGFSNIEAIRTALTNYEGNVEAAVDSLL